MCDVHRLVSEILLDCGDATEVELTRDGHWHVTKTEDFDCPSPEPSFVPTVVNGELMFPAVIRSKESKVFFLVAPRFINYR